MNSIVIRLALQGAGVFSSTLNNSGAAAQRMGNNVRQGAQAANTALVASSNAARAYASATANAASQTGQAYARAATQADRLAAAAKRFAGNRRSMGLSIAADEARELADSLYKAETNARRAQRAMATIRGPGPVGAKLGALNSLAQMRQDSGSQYDALNDSLGTMRNVGAGILGGAVAGGLVIAKGVRLAETKETQLKTIEALSGSRDKANEIYNTTDDMSVKSVANLPELVSAAKTLTAARMFNARNLTAVDDLAAVKRDEGATPQDVATFFARLKSGDFGEAFERARDFGISRQDLEGKGLKFSKGNQFEGTAEEAVEGVVKVIEEKFGGLSEKLATETFEGAVSNAEDALGRLATALGEELIPTLTVIARVVGNAASMFNTMPSPLRKIVAWGGVAIVAITGIVGGGMIFVAMLGQAFIGLMALNGSLAVTGPAAGTAAAGLAGANVGLGALALSAGVFALTAIAAIAVLIGAYLVFKKYKDEMEKPTSSVSDERDGKAKAEDAINAQKVKNTVSSNENKTDAFGRLQLYRAASQRLMDMGDTAGADEMMRKSADLRKTAEGRAAVQAGALRKTTAIDPSIAAAVSGINSLKDNHDARLTAVKQPEKDDDPRAQLEALKAQMKGAPTAATGGMAVSPAALKAVPSVAAATGGMAVSQNSGAGSDIEILEDRIAATEDDTQKKGLREQLRLARRSEKHQRDRERDQKAAERAQMQQARLDAQVSAAEIRAQSSARTAAIKDAGAQRADVEKTALDQQIRNVNNAVQNGMMDRAAGRERISQLRTAYAQRKRAIQRETNASLAQVNAERILSEAKAKASTQSPAQARATLAIAQARAGALGGAGSTAAGGTDAAPGETGSPGGMSLFSWLRRGGSVMGFRQQQEMGQGGTSAAGRAASSASPALDEYTAHPRSVEETDDYIIVRFDELRIKKSRSRFDQAARAFS